MTTFRRKVLDSLERIEGALARIEKKPSGGTVDLGNIPAQVTGLVTAAKTMLDALGLVSHLIDDGNTAILKKLGEMEAKEDHIMATTDEVLVDVQEEATVVGSVETLLTNLSQMIANAGTDPVKLQAIKDQIDQNKARLSAAVVANTPAAGTAAP